MRRATELLTLHKNEVARGIRCGDRFISYSELNAITLENADSLKRSGLQNQNVGIVTDKNSLQYIVAYWSLLIAQNTVVPLAQAAGVTRMRQDANWCDVNWIVCPRRDADYLRDVAENGHFGVLHVDESLRITIETAPSSCSSRENGDDIALILQTSGTSAAPKRAMISHANLLANTINSLATLPLTQSDSCLVVFPLYSITGNSTQLLVHTAIGSDIVLYDKPVFFPGHFSELIEQNRIAVVNCTPAHLTLLAKYPHLDCAKLASLRYIASSASALPISLLNQCIEVLAGIPIVQMYGLTECSPRVTILDPRDYNRYKGSCGKPIQGVTVKIVDENGNPVTGGGSGEILICGENVFAGYYKNKEASEATIKNGWLHSGDCGHLSDNGYLYVTGRKKNVLNLNGVKVSIEEIEALLLEHPAIADVRARAEVDPRWGDIVVADVVLREGLASPLDDVAPLLKDRLPINQWPKKFYLVAAIEKTLTGKTKRF